MVSAKHTPGPWTIRQSYSSERIIVKAPQPTNRVLAGFGSEDEPLDDTDVANARLIAAAPELLQAAMQAESLIPHLCDLDSSEATAAVVEQLRAAIAKATGEQA